MPITPYLDGDHFDPETKRVMGVAFEATMAALRLADREAPFATIVARKIIALAKAGESNPDDFRSSQSIFCQNVTVR